ncbi:MAG: hypothetical protein KGL54_10765, partial [Sphingomonadales bacterium]|nr:hypothetical protein [Sphingomonadales bacterium]
DVDGRPTQGVIEHEHQVNTGRRHFHAHEFETARRSLLEQGKTELEAWRLAMQLHGRPEGTLDLDRPPRPGIDEAGVGATLHPEVRRSLT